MRDIFDMFGKIAITLMFLYILITGVSFTAMLSVKTIIYFQDALGFNNE